MGVPLDRRRSDSSLSAQAPMERLGSDHLASINSGQAVDEPCRHVGGKLAGQAYRQAGRRDVGSCGWTRKRPSGGTLRSTEPSTCTSHSGEQPILTDLPLSFETDKTSPPKMLAVYKDLELAIPDDVEVTVHARTVTVKGPRGELTKVRSDPQLGSRQQKEKRGSRMRGGPCVARGRRCECRRAASVASRPASLACPHLGQRSRKATG